MGSPPRVLVIDDRMPDSRLGSGYSRMFDVVRRYRRPAIGFHCSDDRIIDDPDVRSLGCRGRDRPLAETFSGVRRDTRS